MHLSVWHANVQRHVQGASNRRCTGCTRGFRIDWLGSHQICPVGLFAAHLARVRIALYCTKGGTIRLCLYICVPCTVGACHVYGKVRQHAVAAAYALSCPLRPSWGWLEPPFHCTVGIGGIEWVCDYGTTGGEGQCGGFLVRRSCLAWWNMQGARALAVLH